MVLKILNSFSVANLCFLSRTLKIFQVSGELVHSTLRNLEAKHLGRVKGGSGTRVTLLPTLSQFPLGTLPIPPPLAPTKEVTSVVSPYLFLNLFQNNQSGLITEVVWEDPSIYTMERSHKRNDYIAHL